MTPFVEVSEVVNAFDAIKHIDDDRHVLSEMYETCRHGDGLILTMPQYPWPWSRMDDATKHKRYYTHQDPIEELRATGPRPLYVNSFMSLLLPVTILSRLHQKIARIEQEIDEGFHIGKTLNRLFSIVCNVESRLLTCGIHFSAGGSPSAIVVKG